MRALQPRERRLVAVALLVGAVTLLWLGIVSPIVAGFSERADERRDLDAQHERNAMLIARMPVWRHEASIQRRGAGTTAILAPSAEMAADMLRDRTLRTAESHGSVIKAVQSVPAAPGWVRVRLDSEATLDQLTGFLKQVQDDRPLVVVENVSVTADRAFQSGKLDTMDVRLEIAAPFLAGPVR